MNIKWILLWPVVNPPSLHHRPCETLQGEVLGNLWVLVLDIGLERANEQCLQHILDDLGVLVLTMNYVDWTLNNWTCLQFTYIFEKISPVQLANNIPGHFCLRNFMYRSLQQKVQCAIDSWKEVLSFLFLLVSMNQVGREAAKTAGNGVELNWSWKRKFNFFPESLSKHLLSTLFDDTVGTAVEIVWAKKSDVASLKKAKVWFKTPKLIFPPVGARPSQAPIAADSFSPRHKH